MPTERADAELLSLIRTEFRNTPVRELLHESPKVLLGVSTDAATALEGLDIHTVFDLATSATFEAATKLLTAAGNIASPLYQYGGPSSDLVREATSAGKTLVELQDAPLDVLESLPQAEVATIGTALDVATVRDLALYPPYRTALALLTAVYFPENVTGFDPERPADLVPKTGEYPTERVQYTTLLMDEIKLSDSDAVTDVLGPQFVPLDLSKLAVADAGFKEVAFGALLTFSQSWYAQGVTLGQLLHSTSLAPGESTRIAVIDWSRRSSAGETEVISEMDDLTNDTFHNRSINEVTRAVANEAQGGFSHASSSSTSHQEGTASAMELSAPLGGLFGGPSGSVGHTSSDATTDTSADSYSTSWGHRDIGSTMLQNVNDRTHQNAHSSRNRRASVVKEVSQSEHEGVSTRVIANYNHMHALTVQYYEVVQVYRVEVAITKADKVVFIPVALPDFDDDHLVRRFQAVLARAALTPGIRESLRNLDVLEIVPDPTTHFSDLGTRPTPADPDGDATATPPPGLRPSPPGSPTSATGLGSLAIFAEIGPQIVAAATAGLSGVLQFATSQQAVQLINAHLWSADQVARLSGLLNTPLLRAGSTSLFLPTDITVEATAAASGGTPITVVFHTLGGGTITAVSAESPLLLSQVGGISLNGSSATQDISVVVTLTLNRNGVRFPLQLPAVTIPKGTTTETKLVQVRAGGVNTNLKQHLTANRMYYSQVIFRSLDATQIALLLSGYGLEVNSQIVPVAQVVEPRPIRYVGNYLAFKMNTDASSDPTWAGWLKDHGIQLGDIKEDIIPLASGGTFGEAILGRSNSAEKLDITRFWNWTDSPIPLQPSEIAAVQTGSRATPEDVKPGQLSSPIINITTPTSLPDPVGTAAILAAIQKGDMFRDMSGLQATIGLAQAALQATSAGAATAGQQAGTNMSNLLQANTERQRIAAQMLTELAKTAASMYTGGAVGGGGSGISGGSNHSQDGAKINYFDKTQGSSAGTAGTHSASGANGTDGAAGTLTNGDQSGGGETMNGAAGGGNGSSGPEGGWSQNPAMLAATWGDSEPPASVIDRLTAIAAATAAPMPAAVSAAFVPRRDKETVAGLGARKQAILTSGGSTLDMAVAMLETKNMSAGDYRFGDVYPGKDGKPDPNKPKTGDAACFGIFRQGWYMLRTSASRYRGKSPSDWKVGGELNTNLGLDMQALHESQAHYGIDAWLAGHRNGPSGLSNPNTADINRYKCAVYWIKDQIDSNPQYQTDDTRFWVDITPI
jgi:hypothetical protein